MKSITQSYSLTDGAAKRLYLTAITGIGKRSRMAFTRSSKLLIIALNATERNTHGPELTARNPAPTWIFQPSFVSCQNRTHLGPGPSTMKPPNRPGSICPR